MNPIRAIIDHFTPAWKKTDDYRRWKAGRPSIGEEAMDRVAAARRVSSRKGVTP